ncbi:MAG: hypothetical protein JHC38_01970 [Thiotrichales bacterium]|jgi:hypothetical protein|nr:hypothetical protein [Thiotrichales bacterium]
MDNTEQIKIGSFVRTHLGKISDLAKADIRILNNLTDKDSSKIIFNLDYPFFELEQVARTEMRRRYWQNECFSIFGHDYLVCNHWFERHFEPFNDFLRMYGLDTKPVEDFRGD